jgi:transcriptional regulator with XRE-family HTH domain
MALSNGFQLRAARAMLKLHQRELARLARISPTTLRRLEETDGSFENVAHASTIQAVATVLIAKGCELPGPAAGSTSASRSSCPPTRPSSGSGSEVAGRVRSATCQ